MVSQTLSEVSKDTCKLHVRLNKNHSTSLYLCCIFTHVTRLRPIILNEMLKVLRGHFYIGAAWTGASSQTYQVYLECILLPHQIFLLSPSGMKQVFRK